jgi:hypothetical protein
MSDNTLRPSRLRLLEHEIEEVRGLLGEVPTTEYESEGEGATTCGECDATVVFTYTKHNQSVSANGISRQFIINLIERAGQIYTVALARESDRRALVSPVPAVPITLASPPPFPVDIG